MTKKKRRNVTYKDWITEEGLIKLEGWARDGDSELYIDILRSCIWSME